MNHGRAALACISVTIALLASCSSLSRSGESQLIESAGNDFVAPLPARGDRTPRPGDTVRIMGTELRGNPRTGQRVWVQKALGMIVTVEGDRMRIRILQGHANRGDRLLCCDPPVPGTTIPAVMDPARAQHAQANRSKKTRTPTGSPVHVIGDSLGP